jgi:uncharacterized protein DUF1801
MTKPPRELIDFLYRHDPAIQSLALGLRRVVLDEMVPCHEYIFAMRSKVVLMYGGSDQVIKDNICSISVFTKHVNLGFRRGADLKDGRGILQGSGKTWRHVTLRKLSELDRPELRQYVREARRLAGLKRPRVPTEDGLVTRVKPPRSRLQSWPG